MDKYTNRTRMNVNVIRPLRKPRRHRNTKGNDLSDYGFPKEEESQDLNEDTYIYNCKDDSQKFFLDSILEDSFSAFCQIRQQDS